MKLSAILIGIAVLAAPAFARMEDYGPRRYTQVGHEQENHAREGHQGHEREEHEHDFVIDRRRGPGWGGVVAGGILGAVAGLALGGAVAPPVVYGPPPVGTVVPALPGACVQVPSYNGAVIYNCGGIYYQPFYEGTSLMFQVIPAP